MKLVKRIETNVRIALIVIERYHRAERMRACIANGTKLPIDRSYPNEYVVT